MASYEKSLSSGNGVTGTNHMPRNIAYCAKSVELTWLAQPPTKL